MTSPARKQDQEPETMDPAPETPNAHAKGVFVQGRSYMIDIGEGKYARRVPSKHKGFEKLSPAGKALMRGTIDEQEACAWEFYSRLWEMRFRSGMDSTQLLEVSGGRSGTPWTQSQEDAIKALQRIEAKLSPQHALICKRLCGEGYTMREACKAAGISQYKTNDTIRLALSKLSNAIAGVRII